MRSKTVLLVAVILLNLGVVQAEDKLGVTLNLTYVSRYIFRGYDCYPENHSGIQPGIDVDLYGTGFGFKVTDFRANGGNFENFEKIEYEA